MRSETKKNKETRCETKKMGSRDARQKKWGNKMQDKKNGETRRETKKIRRRDKGQKNGERDAR